MWSEEANVTEENANPEGTEEETEETEETDENIDPAEEEGDSSKPSAEMKKIIAQRDKAKAELRKLREAQKTKETEGSEEESKEAKANRKLIAAEARTQLVALGVTDKDDIKDVLSVLDLSDIEVDEDGEVDSDVIEERVANLKRIFGGEVKGKPRVPRTTTSRDKGGNENAPADPDKARYRRILGSRK